jgi:hypothetical protein
LIAAGKAKPSFLVSHELPLAEASDACRHFDARADDYREIADRIGRFGSTNIQFDSPAHSPSFFPATVFGDP